MLVEIIEVSCTFEMAKKLKKMSRYCTNDFARLIRERVVQNKNYKVFGESFMENSNKVRINIRVTIVLVL